jgi:teichuronic acid biosynthesis glycosyltransferase TuaH
VDLNHFQVPPPGIPEDIASIRSGERPVIGYYGALAAWFDYPLLARLANLRADLVFLLIGPSIDQSLEASGLLQVENIRWIGPKPYAELPRYLRAFDVAAIPFRINEITNATSPIKLFEYMAGGKPVISTPIAECENQEGVLLAADAAAFSSQIDAALVKKGDPAYLSLLSKVARQNTWEARARQILAVQTAGER